MSNVEFPGLNLKFTFSRIAFNIFGVQVYWYAVLIVFAIALSLILLYFSNKKYNIKYEDFLEMFIFILICAILGARIFYVLFNLKYYFNNPIQILNIRNGGLAIFGGIIAGAITTYVLCKIKKINFLDFSDYVIPYVALSQAIGRIGNFFNEEAYGIETSSLFRMKIKNAYGYIEVHPCFLYEMTACLIIFIVLKFLQRKQSFKGEILSAYLIGYGLIRCLIESIRTDSLMFLNFKISQIISIIFIIVGIYTYINTAICRKSSKKLD